MVATSPHDFKLLVAAEGRTATSMDDLAEPGRDGGSAGPDTLRSPSPPGRPMHSGGNGSAPPAGNPGTRPVERLTLSAAATRRAWPPRRVPAPSPRRGHPTIASVGEALR